MKIFDGVEVNPVLSPTMQGVLSVVTLVANSLLEADKVREERQAGEGSPAAPGTLGAVMAQAGLNIPGLEQMLVQLMGSGEEARKVASLIAQNPDSAGLLERFAEHFGRVEAANAKPTVSSWPGEWRAPAAATTARSSAAPTFRPEFTRQGRAAARAAASAAATSGSRSVNAKAEPPVADAPMRSTVTAATPPIGRSSLIVIVEHQLELLRRRTKDHEAELDVRLARAEAQLAALRKELDELVAVRAMWTGPVVSPGPVAEARADAERLSATVKAVSDDSSMAGEAVSSPPLPAANDEEALQAVRLIAEFGDDIDAQHGRQLVRVEAIEEKVALMSTLLQREREALGLVGSHG